MDRSMNEVFGVLGVGWDLEEGAGGPSRVL